jgi:predicted SAM-dependent methyltransferase
LNYEPRSIDGVWAAYSLFHLQKEDFIKIIRRIQELLKPSGIFGVVMQEGEGEVEREEPMLPGEKIYIHLYSLEELSGMLEENGFTVLAHMRKKPKSKDEFPYNKLLILSQLIS